jgi:hypothetical protein
VDVRPVGVTHTAAGPAGGTVPRAAWPLALAIGIALGVVYRFSLWHGRGTPALPAYVWGPGAAVAILVYLWLAGARAAAADPRAGAPARPGPARAAWATLALGAFVAHALVAAPQRLPHLVLLSAIHLPALAWLVLGIAVLPPAGGARERFAAVIKSIEVLVIAAIYAGAAAIFAAVTAGLFAALEIRLPDEFQRSGPAFLAGMVPLLAVASVYDPALPPSAQRFGAGVTRPFFVAARLLLPLTLLVLLVVAAVIPARFAVLSGNRETLVVFNAMLFAVVLLLSGAVPLRSDALAPRPAAWLRHGVAAVALLAAVVSAYALAATFARTIAGGLTANRVTVIGWNVVNILTLLLVAFRAWRAGRGHWEPGVHRAFGAGLTLYAGWTGFVLVVLPHLARAAHWPVSRGLGAWE